MKTNFRTIIFTILLTLLSLTTVLANQVNLTGSSTIEVEPDVAKINLTISARGDSIEEAKQQAILTSQALNETLLNSNYNIDTEDITSNNFNVYPRYDYENNDAIIGYWSYQDFVISVNNLDILNDVIDDITNIENVTSNNVNYSLSNYDEVYNEVLVQAVLNANKKAETLAKGLGLGNLSLYEISENMSGNYYISYGKESSMADTVSKNISLSPSKIQINASVLVTYTY